ncbi:MAG: 2-amino-4-hydroxy-6-hydroxymethyldihydropteridine diphosphokinase [Coriobacteriia bacterium]|nr:2-amino-4-hydroxy-6-hydroxymethyldihydropteridine diphosphokinase [Coriobacteriia bacterium]
MTDAYIGLGANLGDRLETLSRALHLIDELPETHIVAVSHVYETEPWGVTDQPDFANAVAHVRTSLRADVLLGGLQDIETTLGRARAERYGARTIDLDILLFGDEEWASPTLTIPHPHLLEREFAVVPLLKIAPDVRLPDGSSVSRDGAVHGRITSVLGIVSGFKDRGVSDVFAATNTVPHVQADGQDWVEVASSSAASRIDRAPDLRLLFFQSVLDAEQIPYVYDPFAPTENYNPWGLTRAVRLLVPASYAARARRLLAEVATASPQFPQE